jgi:hypothetical protein
MYSVYLVNLRSDRQNAILNNIDSSDVSSMLGRNEWIA